MTITIELTKEEEARLTAKAAHAGLAPADFLRRAIDAEFVQSTLPRTGAELIAAIDSLGLSGNFGDPSIDSPELARLIRQQSETRLR